MKIQQIKSVKQGQGINILYQIKEKKFKKVPKMAQSFILNPKTPDLESLDDLYWENSVQRLFEKQKSIYFEKN